MPETVMWSVLSDTNPAYNKDRIHKMKLLFRGGYDLKDEAETFLFPLHQESGEAYQERVKNTALRPYLTKFVNVYKANLFAVELTVHAQQDEKDSETSGDDSTVDQFYKDFLENCDGNRTSFHEFIKEKVYQPAEVCEYGYVGVDLPKQTMAPANLYQEEAMGLDQPYLYQIDPCDVWDWELNPETGKFNWIKLGYRITFRPNAFSPCLHYWKVCNFFMKDGVRCWETYTTPMYEEDKDPEDKDLIHMTDSGDTSFKEIGIFCLDFSGGQALGFMLGPMVEEDYQMTSLENAYTTKACLTIPWISLKKNPGGNDPVKGKQRGADPRGQFNSKGFIALNSGENEGDKIGILETTGTALKFLHMQSEDRKEQMHEITNQLHSASKQSSSKTGRSGDAMRESRYQMEVTLSDRASQVWKLAKDIFTCLSEMREENFKWAARGLCTETPQDPITLQKAAQNLSKYKVGSKLADKKIRFKIATGTLGKISGIEQEQIRREINDAVDKGDDVELYGPMFDAELQQAINAKVDLSQPEANGPDGKPGTSSGSGPNASPGGAKPASGGSKSAPQPALPGGALPGSAKDIADPTALHDRSVSNAGVAQTVIKQLEPDYDKKLLQWIPAAHWVQMNVPMDSIDDSNRAQWEATKDQGKVDEMSAAMKEGWSKPIVLVNEPNSNKLQLIDGHHRYLAAEANGEKEISAFVAYVGGVDGPWTEMHDLQRQGAAGGKSKQKSQQKDN